jgi:hypothetical protein
MYRIVIPYNPVVLADVRDQGAASRFARAKCLILQLLYHSGDEAATGVRSPKASDRRCGSNSY